MSHTQATELDQQKKPDPLGEHMLHFSKVLKASHDAAVTDFQGC